MNLRRFYIAKTIGFFVVVILVLLWFAFFKKDNNVIVNNNIYHTEEYNKVIEEAIVEENIKSTILPIAEFEKRINKKPFGIYITPQTSPVQPEKFSGYHTGVDVEYSDVEGEVPVYAIADGTVLRSEWVSGYGGMTAIKHNIDGKYYIVIYGHLNSSNLLSKNEKVSLGDKIGILGKGYSNQTDGERKHLHLAIYTGSDINVRGYVASQSELSKWVDSVEFLK